MQEHPRIPYQVHPEYIVFNRNISRGSKELYSIINLFSKGDKGCYASNEYFSRCLGVDERSIGRYLSELEKWIYIKIINKKKKSRRILINLDAKVIYSEPSWMVYQLKDSDNFISEDIELSKKIFKDALESYIKGE